MSMDPGSIALLAAAKERQHAAWSAGDFAVLGVTLQLVGELLCEALDVRSGSKVLDVAAGNGNVSMAAARRFCDVTSTDFVPALLERGKARAAADGFTIDFRVADAEDLPFDDNAFDYVVSTFGVMFAPHQEKAASEMMRVLKPGGKIGLACWTPTGFPGQMFRVSAKYNPPQQGVKPAVLWGTEDRLRELFGAGARSIEATPKDFVMRTRSTEHWLTLFRECFGPLELTFAKLNEQQQAAYAKDLLDLAQSFNRSGDSTMVAPSEYLEIVVVKR
jgi:SAM-dependent methyltransferase